MAKLGVLLSVAAIMSGGVTSQEERGPYLPVVVNTWGFRNAAQAAWRVLSKSSTRPTVALDAVEVISGTHIDMVTIRRIHRQTLSWNVHIFQFISVCRSG